MIIFLVNEDTGVDEIHRENMKHAKEALHVD